MVVGPLIHNYLNNMYIMYMFSVYVFIFVYVPSVQGFVEISYLKLSVRPFIWFVFRGSPVWGIRYRFSCGFRIKC